jgi:hypothetical protein
VVAPAFFLSLASSILTTLRIAWQLRSLDHFLFQHPRFFLPCRAGRFVSHTSIQYLSSTKASHANRRAVTLRIPFAEVVGYAAIRVAVHLSELGRRLGGHPAPDRLPDLKFFHPGGGDTE